MARTVKMSTKKIDLSEGDWIVVKEQLNTGEQKELENCGLMPPMIVDGRVIQPVDWRRHDLERALVFLVDWSQMDEVSGERLPLRIDSLKSLDPMFFEEINSAIMTHVMEMAAAKKALRDAKKAAAAAATTPASSQNTSSAADVPTSQS